MSSAVRRKPSYPQFRKIVYDYFSCHKRALPWRTTYEPYHIVVSEIMLQQTQVSRVITKFPLFIARFPTVRVLAQSSLAQILPVWQGMGYNRRALALKRLAEKVVRDFDGVIPSDRAALQSLPGIGEATSGAIAAFAFNKPEVFVETNIRSVFIFHFFSSRNEVSDQDLEPLIAKTMDKNNPRMWYSALMDYGSFLKSSVANPSRQSRHYVRQPRFEGSDRQIRGRILSILAKQKKASLQELGCKLNAHERRVSVLLQRLVCEGLIKQRNTLYTL
ncbi:MAG: A/G-specific adenine glycosylase [Candidatus Omnitrophica bacterium]|nr:A/G-specific adenine glycosylase [Candidatus Omnitrophota bacterium]